MSTCSFVILNIYPTYAIYKIFLNNNIYILSFFGFADTKIAEWACTRSVSEGPQRAPACPCPALPHLQPPQLIYPTTLSNWDPLAGITKLPSCLTNLLSTWRIGVRAAAVEWTWVRKSQVKITKRFVNSGRWFLSLGCP